MPLFSWTTAGALALLAGLWLRLRDPPSSSAAPVVGKTRHTRPRVRGWAWWAWCILAAWLAALAAVAWLGCFASEEGEAALVDTHLALESVLVGTPAPARGFLWHAAAVVNRVALAFPLFVASHGGERIVHYDALAARGDVSPFNGGALLHRYADVARLLRAADQPRGQYLGAMRVPDQCLGVETLIFQSTGAKHTQLRNFVLRAASALHTGVTELLPPEDTDADAAAVDMSVVKRELVRNLWFRLFGDVPSPQLTGKLEEYFTAGGTCVLGEQFHALTGGYFLRKVVSIREAGLAAALASPGGSKMRDMWMAEEGGTAEEAERVVQQMVDGFLFAGLLGTSHLTTHTLDRIRSSPSTYLPLWRADPHRFLLESARVDPPVTSVTAVLANDLHTAVASGWLGTGSRAVTFRAGTTAQLALSSANRDPAVFGGDARSVRRAREFDPLGRSDQELDQILSWNGVHRDVVRGAAPRGCPGYKLSSQLAQLLIERHLPLDPAAAKAAAADAPPSAVTPPTPEHVPEGEAEGEGGGGVPHDALSAFGVGQDLEFLNTTVGYTVWLLCCVIGILWMKFSHEGYGLVSLHYAHYLLAQATLAAAVLLGRTPLKFHAMLQGAHAYYLLYLRCAANFAAPTVQQPTASPVGAGGVHVLVGSAHVILAVAQFVGGYDHPWQLPLVSMVYGPAACLVMYAITRAALSEENPDRRGVFAVGVIGGAFGLVNLFWPSMVLQGRLFDFFSRLADSTLYVPLVIPSILALDVRVLQGVVTFDDDVPAPDSDTDPDTDSGVDSEAEAREARRAKLQAIRARHMRRGGRVLRWLLLAAAVAMVAALVQPFLAQVTAGPALCFRDDDLAATPDECEEGARVMEHVDKHTRTLYRVVKTIASQRDWPTPDGTAVLVPTKHFTLPKKRLFFGIQLPTFDHDVPPANPVSDALFAFLRMPFFNPLRDIATPWDSLEQARRVLHAAGQVDLQPLLLVPWAEMTSDVAIQRWAFAGLAAHRLRRVAGAANDSDAYFESDWTWLAPFQVRPGFESYGAAARFDRGGTLRSIFWSHGNRTVRPGDGEWEHAKWAFKCSVLVGATLRDHLVGIHFQAANMFTTAVFERLPPSHPLRRFLGPYVFGSVSINLGATKTLATPFGFVHRASALTWPSLSEGFKASFVMNRYVAPQDYLQAQGVGDLDGDLYPFGQDLKEFTQVVTKVVRRYVDLYYVDDRAVLADRDLSAFWDAMRILPRTGIPLLSGKDVVIELLAELIIHVTGIHNHVGNVADYLFDPTFASAKIRPGSQVADIQATFQGLNIGLLTSMKAPRLMSDFSHLLLRDDKLADTTQVLADFQADLQELSRRIDERNERRAMPCNSFNPRFMTSSVSI